MRRGPVGLVIAAAKRYSPGGKPAPTLHQSVIIVADDTAHVLAHGYLG